VSINHLLTAYGYWAVFFFVALESLGVPLPGETMLVAAGAFAGSTHRLSVWAIFVVAASAAIIGDNIGYWIGEKGGYRLLRRYGRYVRVDETKIKIGRYVFDRHGGKVVFFGRFVSVLRTYAAFLAGTVRMDWRKFVLYNAAGGIVWGAIYTFVSYSAGNAVKKATRPVDIGLVVAAVLMIAAMFFVVRRQSDRLRARAEAAYPGPLGES
jgi:membrane protein DedA with SNARE-associated domain